MRGNEYPPEAAGVNNDTPLKTVGPNDDTLEMDPVPGGLNFVDQAFEHQVDDTSTTQDPEARDRRTVAGVTLVAVAATALVIGVPKANEWLRSFRDAPRMAVPADRPPIDSTTASPTPSVLPSSRPSPAATVSHTPKELIFIPTATPSPKESDQGQPLVPEEVLIPDTSPAASPSPDIPSVITESPSPAPEASANTGQAPVIDKQTPTPQPQLEVEAPFWERLWDEDHSPFEPVAPQRREEGSGDNEQVDPSLSDAETDGNRSYDDGEIGEWFDRFSHRHEGRGGHEDRDGISSWDGKGSSHSDENHSSGDRDGRSWRQFDR